MTETVTDVSYTPIDDDVFSFKHYADKIKSGS